MAKETGDLRSRLDAALTELRQLRAERGLQGPLTFAKKEIIDVYPIDKRPTLKDKDLIGCCFDAVNELDRYFKQPEFAPNAVYVMCGQFASGKSRWIKEHKPSNAGTALYIDGCNHSADMRSLFIKRIRSLSKNSRIIVCLISSNLDECLERNRDVTRGRLNLRVPEALMHHVAETFCMSRKSGKVAGSENVAKFELFINERKRAGDWAQFILPGGRHLNKAAIVKSSECGFGKSVFIQNPMVKLRLARLEMELAAEGILAADDCNVIGDAGLTRNEALSNLETQVARIEIKLTEMKGFIRDINAKIIEYQAEAGIILNARAITAKRGR